MGIHEYAEKWATLGTQDTWQRQTKLNTTENYQDCCHRAHPGAYPGVSPGYTVPASYTANHDLLVCPNR